MPMIDWEYYSSHFPAPVPERKFEAVERQAELEFKKVVHEYMREEIPLERQQDAVFQLCNFIFLNAEILAGKAISSASNAGYSESYVLQTADQAADAMRKLIYRCIGTRLAGAF